MGINLLFPWSDFASRCQEISLENERPRAPSEPGCINNFFNVFEVTLYSVHLSLEEGQLRRTRKFLQHQQKEGQTSTATMWYNSTVIHWHHAHAISINNNNNNNLKK